MAIPTVPNAGDSAFPFLADRTMWVQLVQMLGEWQAQQASPGKPNGGGGIDISVMNDTGVIVPAGELRQLTVPASQNLTGVSSDMAGFVTRAPVMKFEDPVWHTKIDNLVLFQNSLSNVASGVYAPTIPIRAARIVAVELAIPNPSATARWLMPDPTNPKVLKTCETSGIYKLVGWYNRGGSGSNKPIAIVDTFLSQPLWRYEMTQDSQSPSDTNIKLLNLDGGVYANTAKLSDPDGLMSDQTSGDKGWCIHVGNKFYAIAAVCL